MMPVITLDGPAGSGKSSAASLLADETGFYQIDSGALYRAFTYTILYSLQVHPDQIANFLENQEKRVILRDYVPNIAFQKRRQFLTVKGKHLDEELRTPEISASIKPVADSVFVRNLVNQAIRETVKQYPVIADGRDMGTEVFPRADLKFYFIASLEVRAQRRFKEFEAKYPGISMDEVQRQIDERDRQDSNRQTGGLKMADNAILVDTTSRNLKEVIEILKQHLKVSKSEQLRNLLKF